MGKTALVCGAGGFVGGHLVRRLKREGFWVRGVDLVRPAFGESEADAFELCDLRDPVAVDAILDRDFDEVYQLAADMGGAGYVFTGENDADIMRNGALINGNLLARTDRLTRSRVFFASSACVYPAGNQADPDNPLCAEDTAFPAQPDSLYGLEKLCSEQMYLAHARNYGLKVGIGRFHNVFGPQGAWRGGREKAPAALCRKVAETTTGGEVRIWGDGRQTRSFLYVDEGLEGATRLSRSGYGQPVNIGSDEMITIDGLVDLIADIAGKRIHKVHEPGPIGVRGRRSDNRLIERVLGWRPSRPLIAGLERTYAWVEQQVRHDVTA